MISLCPRVSFRQCGYDNRVYSDGAGVSHFVSVAITALSLTGLVWGECTGMALEQGLAHGA